MTTQDIGKALQSVLLRPRAKQKENEHYYEGLVVAFDANKNLAYADESATVPLALTQHSRRMAQRIYCVAGRVYCAVGYALANVIIVVGDNGLIVVDCTESLEAGQLVMIDFAKAVPAAAQLPVIAVVYSHNHTDHIGGVRAFVTPEAVANGQCQIIAHSTLMKAVQHNASVVAPILGARSAYSFGALLQTGPTGIVNGGIGPVLAKGKTTFIAPTVTFDDALDITLAGVRFELRHAPSETDDEIIAWLPDLGVLLSAEVVQGECLANVHTLRGTRYRDPQQWVRTLDMMRAAQDQRNHNTQPIVVMVPAHGRPVLGAANVQELLTSYRDAIAFIHDQAVRLMNQGAKPDELADLLPALPPHLVDHAWLGEYYGTVKHSVRQVFAGELGWFDGDPATLDPLPPKDRAARWLALIGGAKSALAQLEQNVSSDPRWAAELATVIIRGESIDLQAIEAAKALKAEAFQTLAYQTENINWRNWYLTAANELRGAYDALVIGQNGGGLASPDILASLEPSHLLGLLAVRVAAERCLDAERVVQFQIQKNEVWHAITLTVRRGVFQCSSALASAPPVTNAMPAYPVLTMQHAALLSLFKNGFASLPALVQAGEISLPNGMTSAPAIKAFFECFDPKPTSLPKLASH